jgi:hypothetical protein
MLLQVFPLLAISLVAYNVMVLIVGGGGVPVGYDMDAFLARGIEISMFSGDPWKFTIGDLLLVGSLFLLFVEILKSTVTTANSIANHALSMVILIVGLIQFLMMPGFATSAFFIILCMMVIDIIAGFSITIVASKRDLGVAPPIMG